MGKIGLIVPVFLGERRMS